MQTIEITEVYDKRELIIALGEGGVPASYRWRGTVFTRRPDGSDYAPPRTEEREATADEAAVYTSDAIVSLNAQIAAKDALIAQRAGEADERLANALAAKDADILALRANSDLMATQMQEAAALIRQMQVREAALREIIGTVKEANNSWDTTIVPLIQSVVT